MVCYCEKCKKTMSEKEFYTSRNHDKYPQEGHKLSMCKSCITLHVDNWNPDTYLWILEEVDVPYIPNVWADILTRAQKSGKKITPLTVIGKYISQMKLKAYSDYRYKDTEFLAEKQKAISTQAMLSAGYDRQEIDRALETSIIEMPPRPIIEEAPPAEPVSTIGQQVEEEIVADLTEEDKIYLCTQWGKTYTSAEWVRLEELYQQMLASYDIQSAGDLNTLKLACKASLKANQLLDIGDIDGAQKAMKMYESMMKAGKWTAAQTKTEDDEYVDSIGEIINICEKDGYIERFYAPHPNDHIDELILDLQHYTKKLVQNETGLDLMIERAQDQIKLEEERLASAREDGNEFGTLFNYEEDPLSNSDFEEMSKEEEEG